MEKKHLRVVGPKNAGECLACLQSKLQESGDKPSTWLPTGNVFKDLSRASGSLVRLSVDAVTVLLGAAALSLANSPFRGHSPSCLRRCLDIRSFFLKKRTLANFFRNADDHYH